MLEWYSIARKSLSKSHEIFAINCLCIPIIKAHKQEKITGVTPAGDICYVSKLHGGRVSDKSGDAVMFDRGFLIDEVCQKIVENVFDLLF